MFENLFNFNIIDLVTKVPSVIVAVTLHEYIKALVSTRLGDPIPKEKGRLTLNPLKHVDVFGAICFLFYNFGWSNPVQTSPIHYKDRDKGTLTTYILPSVANLFVGVAFAIANRLFAPVLYYSGDSMLMINLLDGVSSVLYYMSFHNIALALFNIIPVYPLDGHRILNLFLPATAVVQLQRYETIFQVLLVVAVFLGAVNFVYEPTVRFIMGIF